MPPLIGVHVGNVLKCWLKWKKYSAVAKQLYSISLHHQLFVCWSTLHAYNTAQVGYFARMCTYIYQEDLSLTGFCLGISSLEHNCYVCCAWSRWPYKEICDELTSVHRESIKKHWKPSIQSSLKPELFAHGDHFYIRLPHHLKFWPHLIWTSDIVTLYIWQKIKRSIIGPL